VVPIISYARPASRSVDASDHGSDISQLETSGDDLELTYVTDETTIESEGDLTYLTTLILAHLTNNSADDPEHSELSMAEALLNSNPSREALKKLQKSTKRILAVSQLRSGLQAHNYLHIEEVEDLFIQYFNGINDDQLIDELLNSVSAPLSLLVD
jgi:hypothetical protein